MQNPARPLEWSLSADDTPHVFLTCFTWEIPGPSPGVAHGLLGGWNIARILRYERGRPLKIVMINDLAGLLFNTEKRPNRVSEVKPIASNNGFDPFSDNYFNANAWVDPGPLEFGDAPRLDGDVRGFPTFNEDINIFKVFALHDGMRVRFETQIGNLFNRVVYCDPDTNWSSPRFGTVNAQCNTPRSVQLGVKFEF